MRATMEVKLIARSGLFSEIQTALAIVFTRDTQRLREERVGVGCARIFTSTLLCDRAIVIPGL
jgi:hypothetical protein